ncbi:MAG: hypothetical protein ACYC8S_00220 [Minisyncoccota bacterium]
MKNKIGYLGLLGIPLAVLGIAGSVAFAQTNTPPVQTVPSAYVHAIEQSTGGPGTDNTIQDQANDGKPDATVEANKAGGGEAPDSEIGSAAEKEVPGGHEDIGANADHQFEGVE